MKHCFLLIGILLLTSCAGLYQFTIEVQEPAKITLPADIVDILVVNNSVPQSGDAGIHRTFQGNAIEGMELCLDSAVNNIVLSLASSLHESLFFGQVSILPLPLRNDSDWISVHALTESFKTDVFENQGFDGIISIDRLLLQLDQQVRSNRLTNFRLHSKTTCSIYTNGRTKPVSSFTVSDSLLYDGYVWGDTLDIFKLFPEEWITELTYRIGEQLSRQIVPTWSEKERYLYTGSQARMQEAYRFARAKNWNYSIILWQNEYEQTHSSQLKGKLAANLAVAHEMLDQLDTALQWAITAQNHFREAGQTNTSAENVRVETYINELHQRILNNYLLDLQLGIPEKLPEEI